MTLYELGRLMAELGAFEAMNLDGGGSSEMVVAELGGVVSVPSPGRWELAASQVLGIGETTRETEQGTEVFIRGREREVMNHIGIVAPRPPEVPVMAFDSPLAGDVPALLSRPSAPTPPPPPLPPVWRLGTSREWIAPLIAYGAPALAAAIALVVLGRWRRRRARA